MFSYRPPLKDMKFVLHDVLDAPNVLSTYPAYADIDAALMDQVIEEAGRFASEVISPLNAVGDQSGCRFENGAVTTPDGFATAYKQFCRAGWPALSCSPDYGGQGLPHTLDCVLYEMLSAANQGWTMAPGLLGGAYSCLYRHANEDLKKQYLPKIVSGEWLATMCLTESHAGTDLGLLRTRALPASDGSYRITGDKIFISGGEHDLTDNIVHLVLARLPDAPPGSRGISLFLAPKFLPEGDGPGVRNAVYCTGIEHKMGSHGSATCSMRFDQALGWLVGEPHRGLAAMFVMMNAARLHVGSQGLGIAEAAYQNSLDYAQERLQMKAVKRPAQRKDQPADPIILHPAVQRLVMSQRAMVEGGRMLSYWAATLLDGGEHHPDLQARHQMNGLLALVTPIIKAMMTEQGFLGSSQALQIYGGHGYIRETGIEQYLRDSRVTMIYEGTNEVQALDLVIRKIIADNGLHLNQLLDMICETTAAESAGELAHLAAMLDQAIEKLRDAATAFSQASVEKPEAPYQVAGEMLRAVGLCVIGWFWLRAARVSIEQGDRDHAFHEAKRTTANYYFEFLFPESAQCFMTINNCLKRPWPSAMMPDEFLRS